MKNTGYGEKAIHVIAAVGFFLAAIVFAIFPGLFSVQAAFVALFFLLALKTIGNIIVDSHNTIHYHTKK